ncbi:TPA: hypothetical protein N0F65_000267 [Lagenidium giganteum]|uniref:DDE Tnp4 domain-containing protein n=1 Tax=Lagenidium giganteum TaxID=4803 RepID=A0AAV2Z8A1_9STRA|nr:TPA: hypothetical protein N0F65_000267 [Lagenidium giganteum]
MVSEEEAALILSANPSSGVISIGNRFSLDKVTEEDCIFHFRFNRESIHAIARALFEDNAHVRTANGSSFTTIEAMCILLRRFAYPSRCGDLALLFGWQRSEISSVFNLMVCVLLSSLGKLLEISTTTLPEARLRLLASAVRSRGAALDKCVGFVDWTVRGIARPGRQNWIPRYQFDRATTAIQRINELCEGCSRMGIWQHCKSVGIQRSEARAEDWDVPSWEVLLGGYVTLQHAQLCFPKPD